MMVAVPMELTLYREFTALCDSVGWPVDYALEEFAKWCLEDPNRIQNWLAEQPIFS